MIKGVLFDLDGTLIDSASDLASSVNITLAEFKLQVLPPETIISFLGDGAHPLIERSIAKSSDEKTATPQFVDSVLKRYKEVYTDNLNNSTKPYEGIVNLLSKLQAQSLRLAIITNKPIGFTRTIIQDLELAQFFDPVFGLDSLAEKKPHPLPLRQALSQWKLSADECIMVGDNHTDIEAGNSAGMKTIFCSYGYGKLSSVQSDYRVSSSLELCSLITTLCLG